MIAHSRREAQHLESPGSIEFRRAPPWISFTNVTAEAGSYICGAAYGSWESVLLRDHYSVGGGLSWPQFQIDAAFDSSEDSHTGSISLVAHF